MIGKLVRRAFGLLVAAGFCYGAYLVWENIPAWTKGTYFNDLRIVLALVALFVILSLGEAVWSRLPASARGKVGQ